MIQTTCFENMQINTRKSKAFSLHFGNKLKIKKFYSNVKLNLWFGQTKIKKTDSAGSRAQNVWGAFAARALLQKSLITPSSRCWASRVAWQDCVTSPSSICWHLPPFFFYSFATDNERLRRQSTSTTFPYFIHLVENVESAGKRKEEQGRTGYTQALSPYLSVCFFPLSFAGHTFSFQMSAWNRRKHEQSSCRDADDACVPSHPTSMNSFPTLSISCDPQNALVQRFASCALCGCRAVRLLCVHSSSCNTTLSVGGWGWQQRIIVIEAGARQKRRP